MIIDICTGFHHQFRRAKMSLEKAQSLINEVKNPATGKPLSDEGRIVEVNSNESQVQITYKRDGISPKEKREIEDSFIQKLDGLFEEDNIFIKTVSDDSRDVYGKPTGEQSAPKKEQPATLQAGHGPSLPQKKRVPNVGKVYAISSGKGGVGKSTVTANLAVALTKLGHKVGVIDADIYGPSMPMIMGKRGEKPAATEDKKIKPLEAHGLKFISFGLFINENDPVIWRGPMLGGVLNQFLFDVNWGELDYLLIDMPPGTGDMQLSLTQLTDIDGAFVVTTPQDVALLDSRKGLEMFRQVKVEVLGIIENMSYFVCDNCGESHDIFGSDGPKSMENETSVPLLGRIPLEKSLREASDTGEPYLAKDEFKDRVPFKSYLDIAEKVAKIGKGEKKSSFFNKLFN